MFRDLIFYPLAALLIGVGIYFALTRAQPSAPTPAQILAEGYGVSGEGLRRVTASPGLSYRFVPARANEPAFLQLSSQVAFENAVPSPGIFVTLSPEYAEAFAGHRLRLHVRARAAAQDPLHEFHMGYFTTSQENSDWQARGLSAEWQDYILDFTRGPAAPSPELNYLSIWPGRMAAPLRMDVSEIRVERRVE